MATRELNRKRNTQAAWDKYRRTLKAVKSTDIAYPAIEAKAWRELQRDLNRA